MSIKFKCPKCESERVEEVMTGVVQYSVISDIEMEDGDDNACIDYDGTNCEGGEVDHYQCVDCGFVLPLCNDGEDLAKWCKENCKQE